MFYGADNDGIGTAPYYQFDGNVITDEIKTAVTDAFDAMADGQPGSMPAVGTLLRG